MHRDHEHFIAGIHGRLKVRITFIGKDDGLRRTRICAPMDFGPSRRAKDQSDRYHLWDYDSAARTHTLSLLPEYVELIEIMSDKFDPGEFVTWDTRRSPWFVSRDWGAFS